jgi:DNA (cytosine-5)-methyltransferase 1
MFNLIDLFSGVGGLAQGFKETKKFNTLLANDVDEDMCEAFKLNFPKTEVICDNIANISFKKIVRKKVDVIIGGPPCQAYSTSGKRLLDDKRAHLYHEYYRSLKELRPSIFLYENVRGLLSMNNGKLFIELKKLFSSLGYKISAKVLNAADYGVPQLRQRVIIVGTLGNHKFEYPEPTHSNDEKNFNLFDDKKKYLTLQDAISDLPFLENGGETKKYLSKPKNEYQKKLRDNNKEIEDHKAPNHGANLMKVIKKVPEGGTLKDIPKKFRPKSGFLNSYGRLIWDKPSMTITRNFGTPSSARCIHPKCDRALTTREGARIQSFKDSFKFYGSISKKNLQIGNSVPPLLSKILAQSILNYLK